MSWRKACIALLILILLIGVLFLPQIASMGFGKKIVLKALEAKTKGPVEIDTLSLSWLGPQKIHGVRFSNPNVEGSIEALEFPVPLWSMGSSDIFSIKNGSFFFSTGSIEQVNGSIVGNEFDLAGIAQSEEKAPGYVNVKGKFVSSKKFEIEADLKNVPSGALDIFDATRGLAYDILGPSFNLNGTISNPGPVDLNLASDSAKAVLKGELDGRALVLREPFTASFYLTQGLSESLLRDMNPLFLTGVESKDPIALTISNRGFSLPIHPFSLHEAQIGQATIDMGQVQCRIGKSFASIINLLKASRLSNARQINAWFTPMAFSLQKGVLHTGRMDALLADSLHICTWGDIDLIADRLHMYLGIPADTLTQSFGIHNLPYSFVLKVPITGSTKDPDLEKGPATAKIAAMIAGQQIPKKGKIFGSLVNQFIHANEEKDIPPPNLPFPWERK